MRDAKMKRVASDQRLKDMAGADSLASSDGLPAPGELGSSAGNLSALANGSASRLGTTANGQPVGFLGSQEIWQATSWQVGLSVRLGAGQGCLPLLCS